MKKYLIFDLDGTLIESMGTLIEWIIYVLKKYIWEIDEQKVRYVISNTAGSPIKKQLEMIFPDKNLELDKLKELIYEEILTHNANFFPWVIEKIKHLKEKYFLFLTTWNSTQVAEKHLKEAWIFELFEIIYGSEQVPKSEEHLEYFKDYSLDEDFYKKAIYIWDGNNDRILAGIKNIDFIHIWNDKIDKYEINSVCEIDEVLKLFN